MALPTTRKEFKDYCLRRLGQPLNCINVSPDQIEDRIDDALSYYMDYHFDGTEKVYLKHQITQENIDTKIIEMSSAVRGVVRVFDIGDSVQTNNLFNIRYQIHLNDIFDLSSAEITSYVNAMRHIELLEETFVGKTPIRFNRHANKLHIDAALKDIVSVGQYIIVECYLGIDPEEYPDVWQDWWLLRYGTALIKRQWGENLQKFDQIELPGGIRFNADKIYDQAKDEIDKLEEEMLTSFSLPVTDLMG